MKITEHITLRSAPGAELELEPLPSRPTPGTGGLRPSRPARRGSRSSPLAGLLLPGFAGRWVLLRCAEGAGLLLIGSIFAVALVAWWGS
jgi:hypothetical protein